jgi:hypothetical protein
VIAGLPAAIPRDVQYMGSYDQDLREGWMSKMKSKWTSADHNDYHFNSVVTRHGRLSLFTMFTIGYPDCECLEKRGAAMNSACGAGVRKVWAKSMRTYVAETRPRGDRNMVTQDDSLTIGPLLNRYC